MDKIVEVNGNIIYKDNVFVYTTSPELGYGDAYIDGDLHINGVLMHVTQQVKGKIAFTCDNLYVSGDIFSNGFYKKE